MHLLKKTIYRYTYKTEPVNDETIALERKWAHTTPHSPSDGYRVKIARNFLDYHKIKWE